MLQFLRQREQGFRSPDGGKINSHSTAGSCIAEDKATLPTHNQACELSGQSRSTFLMVCSPDGTKIASTHGDHTVRVTDIRTGRCTHILTGHPRTPWCIAFHPSSNEILASGCLGGEVHIWDLHGGGSEVWKSENGYVIASITFHPVDQVLVIATTNEILFWDWTRPEPFARCKTGNEYERVRWVKFDPLGHYLYTGIANGSTVHMDDSVAQEQISCGMPPGENVNTADRQNLRQWYRNIVDQINVNQRHRLSSHASYPPSSGPDRTSVPMSRLDSVTVSSSSRVPNVGMNSTTAASLATDSTVTNISGSAMGAVPYPVSHTLASTHAGGMTYSGPHQVDIDMIEPRSPAQVEAIEDAQQYAAHITREASGVVEGASHFTSHLGNARLDSMEEHVERIVERVPNEHARPSVVTEHPAPSGTEHSRPSIVVEPARPIVVAAAVRMQDIATTSAAQLQDIVTSHVTTSVAGTSQLANMLAGPAVSHAVSGVPHRGAVPTLLGQSLGGSLSSQVSQPHGALSATVMSQSQGASVTSVSGQSQGVGVISSVTQGSRPVVVSSAAVNSGPGPFSGSAAAPRSSMSSILRSQLSSVASATQLTASTSQNSSAFSTVGGSASILRSRLSHQVSAPQVRSSQAEVAPSVVAPSYREAPVRPTASTSGSHRCEVCNGYRHLSSRHAHRCSTTGVFRYSAYPSPRRCSVASGRSNSQSQHHSQSCSSQSTVQPHPVIVTSSGSSSGSTHTGMQQSLPGSVPSLNEHCQNAISNTQCRRRSSQPSSQNDSQQTPRAMPMSQLVTMSQRLRQRHERLRAHLEEIRERYLHGSSESQPRVIPSITVTQPPESSAATALDDGASVEDPELAGLHVEEPVEAGHTGLMNLPDDLHNSNQQDARDIRNINTDFHHRRGDQAWYNLHRRHLHPHYAVSILDDTINRQNEGLQAAINRAIAGAFMGIREPAVASNIVNLTHRIQRWDFTKCSIPDITQGTINIVVPHCKLHNDASCDISQDGRYLAVYVPSHRGFPDDTILAVFSLEQDTLGTVLYTKSFGPNAISVSMSPLSNYVLVGLAAKRLAWVFTPKQMVAQVYKLKTLDAGEDSMEHICDLMHPCEMDIRTHVSVNSTRWLPGVGEGLIYGTNRGDLHICRPGLEEDQDRSKSNRDGQQESTSIRRNLMQMLGLTVPRTMNSATQTVHRVRRTAATQTDLLGSDSD